VDSIRREPVQARSKKTVREILLAAEEVLAEIGYEAAIESPQRLLSQAGVTKGAFYSYFTSPSQAINVLAATYSEKARAIADDLGERSYASWQDYIRDLISTFHDFMATPAVRELWVRGHILASPSAVDDGKHANVHIAKRMQEAMAGSIGRDARLDLIDYRVALEIISRVLGLARLDTTLGGERIKREAFTAATSYLAAKITASSTS